MNYYNEFDPYAAQWLRELVDYGLIPKGEVDDRSIADVTRDDLRGYVQCHFFAGIGGWSRALSLARWPDDKPCWTGSCPCQAFSSAGKRKGFADERDLWPEFNRLIVDCRPDVVFGEQVENAVKFGWLDRVCRDLEAEGYAVGAAVLGAHSAGAPHTRQRLYWVALARSGKLEGKLLGQPGRPDGFGSCSELAGPCLAGGPAVAEVSDGRGCGGRDHGDTTRNDRQIQAPGLCHGGRLSVASGERLEQAGRAVSGHPARPSGTVCPDSMADCHCERLEERGRSVPVGPEDRGQNTLAGSELRGRQGLPWDRSCFILCTDGGVRRIPAQSVLLRVADGLPAGLDGSGVEGISEVEGFPLTRRKEGRAMLLKGYGNAIVPQTAAIFIEAVREVVAV